MVVRRWFSSRTLIAALVPAILPFALSPAAVSAHPGDQASENQLLRSSAPLRPTERIERLLIAPDATILAENHEIVVAVREVDARPGLPFESEQELTIAHGTSITTVLLSRVFDSGRRALRVLAYAADIEDRLGDGRSEVVVQTTSESVVPNLPYLNSTLEEYWFARNHDGFAVLTWFVHRTTLSDETYDYLHILDRHRDGLLREVHQYTRRSIHGIALQVDRSVRSFGDGSFVWENSSSRLSAVAPRARLAYVRDSPGRHDEITDALLRNDGEPTDRPTGYRVIDFREHSDELFLLVDLGRGEFGWVPDSDVEWVDR